jgi:hypothetical protein
MRVLQAPVENPMDNRSRATCNRPSDLTAATALSGPVAFALIDNLRSLFCGYNVEGETVLIEHRILNSHCL